MGCTQSCSQSQTLATPVKAVGSISKAPSVISLDTTETTFDSRYTLGEILGKGAFSTVRLATKKDDNKKWAAKVIERKNLALDDEEALQSEVEILTKLKHKHVVTCNDFFTEEKNYYLVLEYMEGGELFDRIVKKSFYNEREARDLVCTLLSAIEYCHLHNIAHRDLKPENLLLTSADDDANIKIADFGFAVVCSDNSLTTRCGTPGYVAPEILEGKKYGKSVDMWSVGVITYILLGGYPPFHDENQKELFRKIKRGDFVFHDEYWSHVSTDAKELIKGMLTVDPCKRITAKMAMKHPWISHNAQELSMRNLEPNLAEFKRFNATRKFKAATQAILAAKRFTKMVNTLQDTGLPENAEKAEMSTDTTITTNTNTNTSNATNATNTNTKTKSADMHSIAAALKKNSAVPKQDEGKNAEKAEMPTNTINNTTVTTNTNTNTSNATNATNTNTKSADMHSIVAAMKKNSAVPKQDEGKNAEKAEMPTNTINNTTVTTNTNTNTSNATNATNTNTKSADMHSIVAAMKKNSAVPKQDEGKNAEKAEMPTNTINNTTVTTNTNTNTSNATNATNTKTKSADMHSIVAAMKKNSAVPKQDEGKNAEKVVKSVIGKAAENQV